MRGRAGALTRGGGRVGTAAIYALVIGFALLCLLPFLLVVSGSFTSERELVDNGYPLLPRAFSLKAYSLVFGSDAVWTAYGVTTLVTAAGTVASLAMIMACAYALSVRTLRYRGVINGAIVLTMLFSGGLTPWYILITRYLRLGNTLAVLVIPSLFNAFYMFIARTYFRGLPDAVRESATIDGANDAQIMARVILPMSTPIIAAIGLFVALNYWNDWFNAVMFIDDPRKRPLQLLLRQIVSNVEMASFLRSHGVQLAVSTPPTNGIRLAATIVTVGPIILLYPLLQRYFVKGLALGSVKG